MKRRQTRSVNAGFVGIGSEFPVSIQTMTNVPLADARKLKAILSKHHLARDVHFHAGKSLRLVR